MALPAEWASVEAVAGAVGGAGVRTPTLREALALVDSADLVFTPDTSISHAASACRKPSTVLLKSTHRSYAPYHTPGRVLHWEGDTIQALDVAPVCEALDGMLADAGLFRAAPGRATSTTADAPADRAGGPTAPPR
jgi:hypothetical protein